MFLLLCSVNSLAYFSVLVTIVDIKYMCSGGFSPIVIFNLIQDNNSVFVLLQNMLFIIFTKYQELSLKVCVCVLLLLVLLCTSCTQW